MGSVAPETLIAWLPTSFAAIDAEPPKAQSDAQAVTRLLGVSAEPNKVVAASYTLVAANVSAKGFTVALPAT